MYSKQNYTLRKKTFKPYREQALNILSNYRKHERQFTAEPEKEMAELLINAGGGSIDKIEPAALESIVSSNSALLTAAGNLEKQKQIAKELFVLDPVNAKQLCDTLFTDCNLDHTKELDESEFSRYVKFLLDIFEDFFSKHGS